MCCTSWLNLPIEVNREVLSIIAYIENMIVVL